MFTQGGKLPVSKPGLTTICPVHGNGVGVGVGVNVAVAVAVGVRVAVGEGLAVAEGVGVGDGAVWQNTSVKLVGVPGGSGIV